MHDDNENMLMQNFEKRMLENIEIMSKQIELQKI